MSETGLNNQEKLEEIYHLTVENNEILRSLRKQQYIANAFRVIYWLVILGALGGVYYYVMPIVNAFTGSNGRGDTAIRQFEDLRSQLPETKFLDQFLNSLRARAEQSASTVGQ